MKDKKLNFIQGLPLGIGSIIGSGILFLPSMTYGVSESNVLLSWIITILICIPGVFFLREMLAEVSNNEGMAKFVSLGLGKYVGQSIYLILLGTVTLGMPSAAIIAGEYAQQLFPSLSYIKGTFATVLILSSLAVTLGGVRLSSKVSWVIAAFLFGVAIFLIMNTIQPSTSYAVLTPDFNVFKTYSGVVLAFWAFAGFENLTFLYGDFKNPRRDIVLVIVLSVITCGAVYIGLVANYAALVGEPSSVTTGLWDMAKSTGAPYLTNGIVIFAILAVLINLISWSNGITNMIISSSREGILPRRLSRGNSWNRSVFFLGSLFFVSLGIGLSNREAFEGMLSLVSTNFLVIYALALASYSIYTENILKKILSATLVIFLTVTLSSSGWLLVYSFSLMVLSSLISMGNESRKLDKIRGAE